MRTGTQHGTPPAFRAARMAMWGVIATLLLLPMLAMQFTTEVKWDASDFAAAAVLLVGGGLAYELVSTRMRSPRHRLILAVALVAIVALLWAQGAVGII